MVKTKGERVKKNLQEGQETRLRGCVAGTHAPRLPHEVESPRAAPGSVTMDGLTEAVLEP